MCRRCRARIGTCKSARLLEAGAYLGPDENDEVALNTAIRLRRRLRKGHLATEQAADGPPEGGWGEMGVG